MHALINALLLIAIGFSMGFLCGLAVVLRTRSGRAMQEEVRRESQVEMARILHAHFPTFSDTIRQISPGFCEIFEQATLAENTNLNQVAGVGYGKSLEFLIKDYAKKGQPTNTSEIERALLSSCIRDYIADPAIRESAILAAWLRNDETHYTRKFITKDVQDLKSIIALTVQLIESAEKHKKLEASVGLFGKDMRGGH